MKLLAFVSHGFRNAISYRLNFIAHYISVFVSVLFFYFLDRLISSTGTSVVDGSYFTFLLVGSTVSRYLSLTIRSFAENIRDDMLKGTLEPLLTTATPTAFVLLGPSTWMLLEGTLMVGLQLGIGVLLGADFTQANWLTSGCVIILSLIPFLSYGVLSAAFTLVFKRSDPANWFIGAVSYLFSGVYFPVTILPPILRIISYALPFTYAINGLRSALLKGASLRVIWRDCAALLGFTVVLLPLSLWALRTAIKHLKQSGELMHY